MISLRKRRDQTKYEIEADLGKMLNDGIYVETQQNSALSSFMV